WPGLRWKEREADNRAPPVTLPHATAPASLLRRRWTSPPVVVDRPVDPPRESPPAPSPTRRAPQRSTHESADVAAPAPRDAGTPRRRADSTAARTPRRFPAPLRAASPIPRRLRVGIRRRR